MGSTVLFLVGIFLTDFYIPSWDGNKLIQIATSTSFFNLLFRSIVIIIYGDDRCDAESIIMTYFKSEQDMLWTWFRYLIYQLIVVRIIGYVALYIKANSGKFNDNKFGRKLFNFYHFFKKEEINLKEYKTKTNLPGNHHDQIILMELNNELMNLDLIYNGLHSSLAFGWNNLTFSRKRLFFKQERIILKNLCGQINFGTITALMGPSGAGKTTLLRCINGIQSPGLSNDSEFYVNKTKKIKSVFIVQEYKDHLLMNITVRESLMYSSLLKNNQEKKCNPSNSGIDFVEDLEKFVLDKMEFNHKLNISKILSELMLTNCADRKVSQCSGGEQKRLAIGLELTSRVKPNLICTDEPITGLDSYTAEQVIK